MIIFTESELLELETLLLDIKNEAIDPAFDYESAMSALVKVQAELQKL